MCIVYNDYSLLFVIPIFLFFLLHFRCNGNVKSGEETFFKIKKSIKMDRVFATYAKRKGFATSSLRFLYDGNRIDSAATPKLLEMEDNDLIDCMLEQVCSNHASNFYFYKY